MKNKKKLALSFSGGIDSSFSAFILKKNNFYIEAIFMKNWENLEENNCYFKNDLLYVKNFCKRFKLKLHILDYSKVYWNLIFLNFLKNLKNGLTPNPDIYCNRKIKFKIFFYYIFYILKFDFLLTGHYSGILKNKKQFNFLISLDNNKNQTYFIFNIEKKIRNKIIFPIYNYLKSSLKFFIYYFNFLNFNKKSSIGICFIGEKNFKHFIKKYIKKDRGLVLNKENKLLANHDGIFFYTLGERIKFYNGINKYYVFRKNVKKKILYVTNDKKNLFINHILIKKLDFNINKEKIILFAKIRHSNEFITSHLYWNKTYKRYSVFFKNKQKIISPGQYIVFYKKNICLGGGEIFKIIK